MDNLLCIGSVHGIPMGLTWTFLPIKWLMDLGPLFINYAIPRVATFHWSSYEAGSKQNYRTLRACLDRQQVEWSWVKCGPTVGNFNLTLFGLAWPDRWSGLVGPRGKDSTSTRITSLAGSRIEFYSSPLLSSPLVRADSIPQQTDSSSLHLK